MADRLLNALLIRDTAPVQVQLKKQLAEIDIPLVQVQLAPYIVTFNSKKPV